MSVVSVLITIFILLLLYRYNVPLNTPIPPAPLTKTQNDEDEAPVAEDNNQFLRQVPSYGMDPPVYTQGPPLPYRQLGVMYSSPSPDTGGKKIVLPLYGRPTNRNSNHWNYYTSMDTGSNNIRLQVYDSFGTDCSRQNGKGCAEVQDGSTLHVRPYGDVSVDIYRE